MTSINEIVETQERIEAEEHQCTNCGHLYASQDGAKCTRAGGTFSENNCPHFCGTRGPKMQAEPRKFIQLLVVDTVVILGLCDDGTVWARGDGDWTPFGSAPQGEVTE